MSHISAFVSSRSAAGNSTFHRELRLRRSTAMKFAGIIPVARPN
jgi:hypothetical protein